MQGVEIAAERCAEGTGLYDRMTLHCWGIYENVKGKPKNSGYCVGTDVDGDQVAGNFSSEFAADAKTNNGTFTIMGGTGKYVGITGSNTYVADTSEFRTGSDRTYAGFSVFQGTYKLP
jgi:hypothetical protein